jgi:hypothetical protein
MALVSAVSEKGLPMSFEESGRAASVHYHSVSRECSPAGPAPLRAAKIKQDLVSPI